MEVQRYANIVPNGVQHVSHVDLTVNGETIPAGSLINPLFTNLLKAFLSQSMEVQVSLYKALCGLNKSLYEGSERYKRISGKSIEDLNKANSSPTYEEMDPRLNTLLNAATERLYH